MQIAWFSLRHWCVVLALNAAATIVLADVGVGAARIPLPRPRPPVHSPQTTGVTRAPANDPGCAERLGAVSLIPPLVPLKGPGACEADDVFRLVSISTVTGRRVGISPPAVLR